ncbi:hypothetical protein Pfo_022843 [Paulownia fortunei]|nr:hypothetical protein Pfo_022843 [Paulownia fortunei]
MKNVKSLFRRYERWKPVHPTYKAFWGIGVTGYVGACCGAEFNVGITLLGVCIGRPANYLFTVPQIAGSLLGNRSSEGDGRGDIRSHISNVRQSPSASFSDLVKKVQSYFFVNPIGQSTSETNSPSRNLV